MTTPNFSAERVRPFPWPSLRRMSRDEAAIECVLARWLGASSLRSANASGAWSRLRRLLRLDAAAAIVSRSVGVRSSEPAIVTPTADDPRGATRLAASAFTPTAHAIDPHAAAAVVRIEDVTIEVLGSSTGVRAIAQRLLGGPDELAAPRPLGVVEQSLWTLVVATALEDLGIVGHVWPQLGPPASRTAVPPVVPGPTASPGPTPPGSTQTARLSFDVTVGEIALAVELRVPRQLAVRMPRTATSLGVPTWLDRVRFDLPIIVGRCAVHREDLARLAVRSLVTLERPGGGGKAALEIFGGVVGLTTRPGALVAEVTTGYVRSDMALPDEAHVELTVGLGTTQLTLRQITELAVGQIVQLGRPLGGPFELRAAGRVLGRGELVDVDGELGVRIVSLGD